MEGEVVPSRTKKRNKIVCEEAVSVGDVSAHSDLGNSFWFDEAPINKTGPLEFQALLEQELARDKAAADLSHGSGPNSGSGTKRTTFLKRGSGGGAAFGKTEAEKRRSLGGTPSGTSSASGGGQRQPFSDRGNQIPSAQAQRSAQRGSENEAQGSVRMSLSKEAVPKRTTAPMDDEPARPSTAPSRQNAPTSHPWDEVPVGGGHTRQEARAPKRVVANAWDEVPIGGQAARNAAAVLEEERVHARPAQQHTEGKVHAREEKKLANTYQSERAAPSNSKPVARKLLIDDDDESTAKQALSAPKRVEAVRASNGLNNTLAARESTALWMERELEDEELREFESLERRVHEEEAEQDFDEYDAEDFEAEGQGTELMSSEAARGEDEDNEVWGDRDDNDNDNDNDGQDSINTMNTGSSMQLFHTSHFVQSSHRASEVRDSEEWDEPLEYHTATSLSRVHARLHESVNTTLPSPPRSALVNKLFNGGKDAKNKNKHTPEQTKQPQQQQQQQQQQSATSKAVVQGAGAAVSFVDERVAELESEIMEFKKQNQLLQSLHADVEREKEIVRQERGKIADEWKEAEQRFEAYKEAEEKRLKKERRDADKHVQIYQAQVQELKTERDTMKKEIASMQADAAKKEKKLKMELERVRQQLEEATQRNAELVRELKFSEEARIAQEDRKQLREQQARLPAQRVTQGVSRCLIMGSPSSKDELAERIAQLALGENVPYAHDRMMEARDSPPPMSQQETTIDRSGIDGTCFSDMTLEIDAAQVRKKPSSGGPPVVVKQQQQQQQQYLHEERQRGVGREAQVQREHESARRDQEVYTLQEIQHGDGKVEQHMSDGRKVIIFSNGTRKEILKEGGSVVHFSNNDVKRSHADGKVVYFYAETKTSHTTYPNGLEVFEFANKQQEKHFPDGRKEILFPDSTLKVIHPTGEEDSVFPDGTVQRIFRDGTRIIEFTNGHKETLNPDGTKVREVSNGSIRKMYAADLAKVKHK